MRSGRQRVIVVFYHGSHYLISNKRGVRATLDLVPRPLKRSSGQAEVTTTRQQDDGQPNVDRRYRIGDSSLITKVKLLPDQSKT